MTDSTNIIKTNEIRTETLRANLLRSRFAKTMLATALFCAAFVAMVNFGVASRIVHHTQQNTTFLVVHSATVHVGAAASELGAIGIITPK